MEWKTKNDVWDRHIDFWIDSLQAADLDAEMGAGFSSAIVHFANDLVIGCVVESDRTHDRDGDSVRLVPSDAFFPMVSCLVEQNCFPKFLRLLFVSRVQPSGAMSPLRGYPIESSEELAVGRLTDKSWRIASSFDLISAMRTLCTWMEQTYLSPFNPGRQWKILFEQSNDTAVASLSWTPQS